MGSGRTVGHHLTGSVAHEKGAGKDNHHADGDRGIGHVEKDGNGYRFVAV